MLDCDLSMVSKKNEDPLSALRALAAMEIDRGRSMPLGFWGSFGGGQESFAKPNPKP